MTKERKHILIVDDIESNREMLGDLLSEDYDVSCASDGVEALNCLRNHKAVVGSYHDIQGFDLNYAGVILGTVKLRKTIQFQFGNRGSIEGRQSITKNTPYADELVQNEIGVLLSRGIKGLYLYFRDQEMANAVIKAMTAPEGLNGRSGF